MAEICDFEEEYCEKNNLNFLGLPWQDVIFSHIFPYLSLSDISRCRRISKMFNDLCISFFKCCHRLDCSLVANRITERAFSRITRESSHLQILILENCKSAIQDETLMELLQRNSQLTYLSLNGCNGLSNKCLRNVGQNCPKLNKIYLRECRWVSLDGIINIVQSCKELRVVDLSGCWEVNDECLTVLAKSCPSISQLAVNGCYGVTDLTLHVISHHLSKLSSLELNGCWRITNHAIQLIGEHCHGLRYLKVKDCRDITEATLARLRVKGVDINVEPVVSNSLILRELIHRPTVHITPFLRLNPS